MWGPPKSGKTFWVLDLAMQVALGQSYRERRVDQETVERESPAPPVAPGRPAIDDDRLIGGPGFQLVLTMSAKTQGVRSAGAIVREGFEGVFGDMEIVFDLEKQRLHDIGPATGNADGFAVLAGAVDARLASVQAQMENPPSDTARDALETRVIYWREMSELVRLMRVIDENTVLHGRPAAAASASEAGRFATAEIIGDWSLKWSGRFLGDVGVLRMVDASAKVEEPGAITNFAAWQELHANWPVLHLSSIAPDVLNRLKVLGARIVDGTMEGDTDRDVQARLLAFFRFYGQDQLAECTNGAADGAAYCLRVQVEAFDGPLVHWSGGAERVSFDGAAQTVDANINIRPKMKWSPELGVSVIYPAFRLLGDDQKAANALAKGLTGIPSRWGGLSRQISGEARGGVPACAGQFARAARLTSEAENAVVERTRLGFSVGGPLKGANAISGKALFVGDSDWPCGRHEISFNWKVRIKPGTVPSFSNLAAGAGNESFVSEDQEAEADNAPTQDTEKADQTGGASAEETESADKAGSKSPKVAESVGQGRDASADELEKVDQQTRDQLSDLFETFAEGFKRQEQLQQFPKELRSEIEDLDDEIAELSKELDANVRRRAEIRLRDDLSKFRSKIRESLKKVKYNGKRIRRLDRRRLSAIDETTAERDSTTRIIMLIDIRNNGEFDTDSDYEEFEENVTELIDEYHFRRFINSEIEDFSKEKDDLLDKRESLFRKGLQDLEDGADVQN